MLVGLKLCVTVQVPGPGNEEQLPKANEKGVLMPVPEARSSRSLHRR